MTIQQITDDKTVKRLAKRQSLVDGILDGTFALPALSAACSCLPEKKISLLLEAMEEASRSHAVAWEEGYLELAERYLLSSDPSCRWEACRIVGNLAAQFPGALDHALPALLQNANHEGTVIRWASAYALARIVVLPPYAKGALFEQVTRLYEREQQSGVKNQYGKALKKAEKMR